MRVPNVGAVAHDPTDTDVDARSMSKNCGSRASSKEKEKERKKRITATSFDLFSRYSSIQSVHKALLLLLLSWSVALLEALPVILRHPPAAYWPAYGACLPEFKHNSIYPPVYFTLGFFLPMSFVLAVNLKVVNIAKYHQYRCDDEKHHVPATSNTRCRCPGSPTLSWGWPSPPSATSARARGPASDRRTR